eukprot:TRINITY_DN7794_c0_g1_i3.p1 TRINITY_DN7794_c0_g1~~TRINITY_DN7794_c0_g1_i3.p1  ORF type:complete len:250 (+),score=52.26 TRINITY_DN7794_c0_g1_i3:46-795(+)
MSDVQQSEKRGDAKIRTTPSTGSVAATVFRSRTLTGSPMHFDDVASTLCMLLANFQDHEHLEIEIKLGVLLDRETRQRIKIPVISDTILSKEGEFGQSFNFTSGIDKEHFRYLNHVLNKQVEKHARSEDPIFYKRHKEADEQHEGNVRVTKTEGGEFIRAVRKNRLCDYNIYSPNLPYDFRVSVSEEVPASRADIRGNPRSHRKKDRLSYKYAGYSYDLTQAYESAVVNAIGNCADHRLSWFIFLSTYI